MGDMMMKKNKTVLFKEALEHHMALNNINPTELARRSGVPRTAIYGLLRREEGTINVEYALMITKSFNMQLENFVTVDPALIRKKAKMLLEGLSEEEKMALKSILDD